MAPMPLLEVILVSAFHHFPWRTCDAIRIRSRDLRREYHQQMLTKFRSHRKLEPMVPIG
jgi:hypothetical protein